MLTQAKTVNTKEPIEEIQKETNMAAKAPVTLDDLFKEFQKNQQGNKEIQTKLNNIQTTVNSNTEALNVHIKVYEEEMQELTGKIKTLHDTVNTFEQAMNAMSDDLKDLKDENLKLRKRIYETENVNQRFMGLEEEGKRRNIIIDGIKEAPFHKTKEVVTELCSALGVELTPVTVVNMFRLGAQRADATQPRPVKVKFQSNLTKQTLYKNISSLKDDEKWARISIRDDVTEEMQDIQRDLRSIAASARSQGLKAQVRGKALILEDKRYSYEDINDLPNDLSLENAKVVKTSEGVAFQGKHVYLSNLADCQIEEGKESFSNAEQYILIHKARLANDQFSEGKSLLPIQIKLLEKVVHNRMMTYFDRFLILNNKQGGFRPNHSTIDTIVNFTEDIYKNMNKGQPTIAVYIDLRKAFDTVNHSILLKKLHHLGIRGSNYDWVKNYLHDRTQCTLANNLCSPSSKIVCGVPQGSVLGPLLFLIYVNDMKNVLCHSNHHLYADDTVIYISSNNINDAVNRLQIDLDKYGEWCIGNKLTVNTKKSNFVIYGTRSKISRLHHVRLEINHEILTRVPFYKYLGVFLDTNLNFNKHVDVSRKLICHKLYLFSGDISRRGRLATRPQMTRLVVKFATLFAFVPCDWVCLLYPRVWASLIGQICLVVRVGELHCGCCLIDIFFSVFNFN